MSDDAITLAKLVELAFDLPSVWIIDLRMTQDGVEVRLLGPGNSPRRFPVPDGGEIFDRVLAAVNFARVAHGLYRVNFDGTPRVEEPSS